MEQQERALSAYVESVRDEPGTLAVDRRRLGRAGPRAARIRMSTSTSSSTTSVSPRHPPPIVSRGSTDGTSTIPARTSTSSSRARPTSRPPRSAPTTRRAPRSSARASPSRGVDGLEQVIERIATLPDEVWAERVRSHVAQARLYGGYFLKQAVERGDPFLRRHAGLHLSLAAARAALASSTTLMQGPKYISRLVRTVPTPDGFVEAWERVVADPDIETAGVLMELLDEWLGRGPRA